MLNLISIEANTALISNEQVANAEKYDIAGNYNEQQINMDQQSRR